ncbi:MAG: hypothetical protein B5M55_00685 [Desulfococcus sp. 4484_242]|nr:MAG: hypothetical protein B5M55_00685 [Desulfococcus sp. 4484_242]
MEKRSLQPQPGRHAGLALDDLPIGDYKRTSAAVWLKIIHPLLTGFQQNHGSENNPQAVA